MLNRCRYMFSFSVQLLFVLLICFDSAAVHAEEGNKPKEAQMPQSVDLFVPHRTIVETQGENQKRDSFAFPSLASADGVLVSFAESHTDLRVSGEEHASIYYADVVAGYINSAENWLSFVAEANANEWKAYSIFNTTTQEEYATLVIRALKPTTIAMDNKVFLLVGDYHQKYDPSLRKQTAPSQDLYLLVGEATQDKVIQWGEPTSILSQIEPYANQSGVNRFGGSGGSGIVMEDGTLVFPVMARNKVKQLFLSMIIYSKDDGKNWVLPHGMLPTRCTRPLIVEWEQGQLVMVAKCFFLTQVFESRDMGATWTRAVRTLTRVQPLLLPDAWRTAKVVGSLTTATIAGKKVMLYTQKEIPPWEIVQATALYLWVTDNNRTFHVGHISMDTAEEVASANTLLHCNDVLYLLQERGNDKASSLFLALLTEQLKTITSVLETWAKLDSYFSELSVPTAGLVGFLSDASGDGTWNDAYRCVNATVRNAKKVENGFNFTGPKSYAIWPVNVWKYHYVHSFVDYEFTLVAAVTIHKVMNRVPHLLGALLSRKENLMFMGLSYTAGKQWGTVFNGITTIALNSSWEPGEEYKVALMLQGNKGSVYVDGVLMGSCDTLPILEARRHQIARFYFGGGKDGSARVRTVFLYNRPLNAMELKAVDSYNSSGKLPGDSSTRANAFRVSILLLVLLGFAALC
ncbi:group II trans-sialidase superfamily [Trypanosoma rangeli]|uniref:Group II trans-sialidase superfamily n=1 Tax=Trypanosoma rangeli TaxID=5698 RepID=A0A422MUZ9_TRYRA|nr:group II trans-sialidase superfamily [Trypanosoma rangeli]RNE96971.1 group II trans-sialidase superfamily [Trypanosoma rangeli]|eukprot:RNE96971.1 group II trans-sialidase superfamily [Trypanosoma rangeli]